MEVFSFVGFRKSSRRKHRVPATKTPRFRVRAILQKKKRASSANATTGVSRPKTPPNPRPRGDLFADGAFWGRRRPRLRRGARFRRAAKMRPRTPARLTTDGRNAFAPKGGVPAELRFPAPPVLCVKGISKAAGTQTDRRPLSVFSHQLSVACHFALTKSSDSTISIR